MTGGSTGLVLIGLALIAGSLLVGTLAVVGARLARSRRDRRVDLVARLVRPHLLALLAGTPADLPEWRGRRRRAFEGLARRHLTLVRGEAHQALVDALDRSGVLERARRQARSHGATRRCRGLELLGRAGLHGDRTVVEARLHDRDADARIVAARALGRIGDPAAAPALLASVTGPRPVPFAVAGQSLVELGPSVVDVLEQTLAGGVVESRPLAAEVLGLLRSASSVPALLRAVEQGGEIEVRAIRALGRIGSRRAAPALVRVLAEHPAWAARAVAARALGAIGDPDSAQALVRALEDERYDVAANAGVALGELGSRGHAWLAIAASGTTPGSAFARRADARRLLHQASPVPALPIAVT